MNTCIGNGLDKFPLSKIGHTAPIKYGEKNIYTIFMEGLGWKKTCLDIEKITGSMLGVNGERQVNLCY